MDSTPPITSHFDHARDVVAHEKYRLEAFDLRQDEIRVETGEIDAENTSRRLRIARSGAHSQQDNKSRSDIIFDMLLQQMLEQLDLLTQRMDELHDDLENKYGQGNAISGMAQAFLSPDKLAGFKTDEDKMNALADKFLNPDGSIKDKYKDLQEAQYVQAWREAQRLQMALDKYENKNVLTLEDKQDICEIAKSSSLSANAGAIVHSASQDLKSAIETQVIDERADKDIVKTSSSITFGQS